MISYSERYAIAMQLLIEELGYKEATELFDAALENYDPVEYAVMKARENKENTSKNIKRR